MRILAVALVSVAAAAAQPRELTLEQAEQTALRNHPRIASASFNAQAARAVVQETRAAWYPSVAGNLTSAGADQGTAIAAGTLPTSALSSRAATGITLSQLLTDFGRTSSLVESAKLRAAAQERTASATRADVVLRADSAYYATLASEGVLKVAQATLEARKLTLRQIQALAQSSLRSTLDVSFAEVAVSEAELALAQAENEVRSSHAVLSAALGFEKDEPFTLADVAIPPALPPDVESLVSDALNNRPDLSALKLNQSAAQRFAEAEKRLMLPSVSLIAVGGVVPAHQEQFASRYGAAGVNVTIPVLNGGLYAARRTEAQLRAQASQKDAESLAVQVAGNVRVAWLEANTAFQRLAVTARLAEQAGQTLHLASTRYEIGLGSILEVTQAQVALTSAQIGNVNARYDYLSRIAALNYATGVLH